jgi:uncharacterized protein
MKYVVNELAKVLCGRCYCHHAVSSPIAQWVFPFLKEIAMLKTANPAQRNALSWFEIPSLDLDKSQAFYEAVLGCTMRREAMGPSEGAVFPYDNDNQGVGGALLCGPTAPTRAKGGVLVYLDCAPSKLDDVLARVRAAGGGIAAPRQALPPGMGFIAQMTDPDGNTVGLHAMA